MAISERKLIANRANALKSRGPKTPQGKAASAQNGTRHGMLSKSIVLAGESETEFAALANSLHAEFQPATTAEKLLVESMAAYRWRLMRLWSLETAEIEYEIGRQTGEALTSDAPTRAMLALRTLSNESRWPELASRYEHRQNRGYHQSLDDLLKLQAQRIAPPSQKNVFLPCDPTHITENKTSPEICDPNNTPGEPIKSPSEPIIMAGEPTHEPENGKRKTVNGEQEAFQASAPLFPVALTYIINRVQMSRPLSQFALRALTAALALSAIPVAEPAGTSLDRQFTEVVRPFVTQYCVTCHSGNTPAAQFDLSTYTSKDLAVRDHARWALVIDKLTAKQMPPAGMPAPPDEARQKVVDWVKAMRSEEAMKHAGDPGPVLARRLSNAEYNYTIRDLTGVDIRPTREFPVDPANQAGFDNSGESLTMSPALLTKYLQAAHEVSDHMVLTPDGINFAATPMLVETDKDKYTIQRIMDFYNSQPTDFADYFRAAWKYKYRIALGKPTATLAQIAAESKLSAKYLPLVWNILQSTPATAKTDVGPIAKLQKMFQELPKPDASKSVPSAGQFSSMRDFVNRIRRDTGMQYAAPTVKGLPGGSEALMDWKLQQFAAHHRESDPAALRNDTDPPANVFIPRYPGLHMDGAPHWAALTNRSRQDDPDLAVPAAEKAKYQAAFARFASVFPDTFVVSERGRYFPDNSQDQGRFLSAGYHNVMGYYRDDTALRELILDDKGIHEINKLWDEFDYIAAWTERTWVQYYFNQSGEVADKGDEGGSERPVGHEVTDTPVIMGLKAAYLAKAAADPKPDPNAPGAITEHFDRINATLRSLEKMHTDAEPKHLAALVKFAAKAYRRNLTKAESDDILAYYHQLRDKSALSHEDAIRDSIVAILMSPDFCYRIDLSDANAPARSVVQPASLTTPAAPSSSAGVPLSGFAIASRLSYFLWSSMPDAELLSHAAAGDLQNPIVLLAQTKRMLKDARSKGMATEFGGNWLEFRRFENHNGVDRQRFPDFTNELREAMFEEPVRYLHDTIQNDRSVYDLLFGNYTFVNPVLAQHYRLPVFSDPKPDPNQWIRVDNADMFQRGGLIPMAAFLTQNSPGLRTSPVKRGHWLVSRVLGEVIPPPPPVVPELPNDEAKSDLPIRALLAQHRANPVCGSCHARFDVFGLALEGYGPTGEARSKDLGGRMVDASANLPGGVDVVGIRGVKDYIRERRLPGFVDGLSRKLLSYALSRSLLLSDEPLISTMEAKLAANGNHFDSLVESIVTSSQFRNKRPAEPMQPAKPGTKTASISAPKNAKMAEAPQSKRGM